ncbi:hypothetical protein H0H10_16340 [Streptomyces sp. TRM S81-3]|uniref:Secreted protein n=1 Tax=Streptomyces griseicoloratus TaxID=2752516 RepID=A0A926L2G8_9ACTN|nr:hypothetical protein [Streptomyces griseicoloratus]MBD0420695.1 hypothetical protein [Streptomyces griseicoloratus]
MRKRLVRHALGAVAAAALAWSAIAWGPSAATATSGGSAAAAVPVAGEAPGYAVEDFNYPGADKIQGFTLKRGDGHIVLATCGSATGLLEVWSSELPERVCFRVTGDSGFLTLEMPAVFSIRGNDYTTQVDMTVDDTRTTYDIDKNIWNAVGESTDGRTAALVEIRTSK